MAIKRLENRRSKPLLAEHKVAFALLLFLGLGGIVFGYKSFGASLARPIDAQLASLYADGTFLTSTEREEQALEESKAKDTDADGLVDYDELYVYKTSPYLADSDSDGFSDYEEVYSGNNPNCPSGQDCGVIAGAESVGETDTIGGLVEGTLAEDAILDAGSVDFESAEDVAAFFQQATVADIRTALVEAGMDPDELALIDDETLMAYFSGELQDAAESGELESFVQE